MFAVVKLLRRTNHVWTSPSIAHLEKSVWCGFDRFYSAKNEGESSDDESSRLGSDSPGPSGRDMVKDADWEAKDAKAQAQAMELLRAALDEADEGFDGEGRQDLAVSEGDQKSLRVGVVGSPNAGKSTLTNHLVGFFTSCIPFFQFLIFGFVSFLLCFFATLFAIGF